MPTGTVVDASVVFLTLAEGGRSKPPNLRDAVYRPHLVIGDPSQRKPLADGNRLLEDYLGVAALDGPDPATPGESAEVRLALIYSQVDYGGLVPGATFTVREGSRVVGFGSILSKPYEYSW